MTEGSQLICTACGGACSSGTTLCEECAIDAEAASVSELRVPRFGEAAPVLVEHGYQPVPLQFGKKWPILDDWPNFRCTDADYGRFAQDGTGIICGKVVGIDIDVRDAQLAAQIDAMATERFGAAPRRIGQAPKVLLLLRAEAPFSKI